MYENTVKSWERGRDMAIQIVHELSQLMKLRQTGSTQGLKELVLTIILANWVTLRRKFPEVSHLNNDVVHPSYFNY